MSEETKVATETASEETTQETTNDSTDNSALIAESKKYRKRSQEAEARLAGLESKLAKAEEDKLKEKEDFKTLYEKVASENQSLTANAEKWSKYEEAKRASLIELHPEDDREALANLPLDTLEYVTNKINNAKPNAPEVSGQARVNQPTKPYSQLTDSEKKANWESILNQFNTKMSGITGLNTHIRSQIESLFSENMVNHVIVYCLSHDADGNYVNPSSGLRNALKNYLDERKLATTTFEVLGGASNIIQYLTIATTGNAADFGDLTVARINMASCGSSTRGLWAGGQNPSYNNTIDYSTIATTGNATDFGDMS